MRLVSTVENQKNSEWRKLIDNHTRMLIFCTGCSSSLSSMSGCFRFAVSGLSQKNGVRWGSDVWLNRLYLHSDMNDQRQFVHGPNSDHRNFLYKNINFSHASVINTGRNIRVKYVTVTYNDAELKRMHFLEYVYIIFRTSLISRTMI